MELKRRGFVSSHCTWIVGGALLGVLGVSSLVQASTIAGATALDFTESLTSPIPGQSFNGVGTYSVGFGRNCSGVLISPQHVLTAAHCFIRGSDGLGAQIPFVAVSPFRLPEKPGESFNPLRVDLMAGFLDAFGRGQGHRIVGRDLAIITLAAPIEGATYYPINTGQIADERTPTLTTVKVGFGVSGNGAGATGASGSKRYMLNIVDQFGPVVLPNDAVGARRDNPPANTLVYDFDNPAAGNNGSTALRNAVNAAMSGAVADSAIPCCQLINYEGSPASGDSGGPMFQRADALSPWILVGITSSGSDDQSRFGSVAYDTRLNVAIYRDFITTTVVPEPSTLVLVGLGGWALVASRRLRRKRDL